jgi:MFS family permease
MTQQTPVVRKLIPFTVANFLGFLAIGIPLPVLSIYVHDVLGFSPFVVGCVIGLQSLATLLTRQTAGRSCDTRGPKRTAMFGFASASGAGVLYLAAAATASHGLLSVGLLSGARLALGLGESLFITALSTWSIVRVGQAHAGRAMAWSGIAMYGALAAGAPFGLFIYRLGGFDAVAACAVVSPLLGALLTLRWPDAKSMNTGPRLSFLRVLHTIWAPGLGMALASSGIGTLGAFLTLRYQMENWSSAGIALTSFGVSYLAVRILFGGLPDRIGGYPTGAVSLFVEAIGLLTIWMASSPMMALTGATVTGIGYSLVFPSLGVQALKRVPSENRGLVISAYLACFDLGLAVAGPGSGFVARMYGLPAAFFVAAMAALTALILLSADRVAAARGRLA